MSRILPILFSTDMVKAILDGRKTATRRLIKPQPYGFFEANESPAYLYDFDPIRERIYPQYQMGDILYVRETVWQKASGTLGMDGETETALWNEFKYVATDEKPQTGWNYSWIKRPSIHMPKEAARIWLKVTAVRAERLRDITEEQARAEGFTDKTHFIDTFLKLYPDCSLNTWIWAYEFQRCEKPEYSVQTELMEEKTE